MKKFFLAILLIAGAAVAHAQFLVMHAHNLSITLTGHVCPDEIRSNLKPKFKDGFHEAWIMLNGRQILACWIRHVEDPKVAAIVTETGELFGIELSQFKVDAGS